MKNYYLYLDESGNFNEDLRDNRKKECLVGGILLDEEGQKTLTVERAEMIRKNCQRDLHLNVDLEHATKLDAKYKYDIHSYILNEASKFGTFVLFENSDKTDFNGDERTYLNIFAEGIVQLWDKLCSLCNDTINLQVNYGRRKNVKKANGTGQYFQIDYNQYKDRIYERKQFFRVKGIRKGDFTYYDKVIKNAESHADDSFYTLITKNDKTDSRVILCDYICNTRFTNWLKWDDFKHFYNEEYIFNIKDAETREGIDFYIANGMFDYLALEWCNGNFADEECERIASELSKLGKESLKGIMEVIAQRLNERIVPEANYHSIDNAIGKALGLADIITAKTDNRYKQIVDAFKADLIISRMTIYNHEGKIEENKGLIEEFHSMIHETFLTNENLEMYYKFYNRLAVIYYDCFDFESVEEILKRCIETLSEQDKERKKRVEQLSFGINKNAQIKSEQYNRFLGTEVMYKIYCMKNGKCSYEEAKSVCDEAIKVAPEADIKRHLMKMVEIEATAGHEQEAVSYLNQCYVGQSLSDVIVNIKNANNRFDWLCLSKFFAYLPEKQLKLFPAELEEACRAFVESTANTTKIGEFPGFITATNFAEALVSCGGSMELLHNLYRVLEVPYDAEPLVQLLEMMCELRFLQLFRSEEDFDSILGKALDRIDTIKLILEEQNLPITFKAVVSFCSEAIDNLDYAKIIEIKKYMIY